MTSLHDLLVEDTPLKPVQQKSKQGALFLAAVIIGCTICVPVFVMGAQLSAQLPFDQFFIACIIGGILSGIIAIATGIVGQKTGLPTAMLARISFGTKGYIVANLAMGITAVGWFGVQTGVFSTAFVQLADQVWGIALNNILVTIVSGLVMTSTAVIGFRGLGRLSYLTLPLLIAMLFIPLYIFTKDGLMSHVPVFAPVTQGMAFGTAIAVVAGAYSFAATMPDVTRFMRDVKSTVVGLGANFFFMYPLLLVLTGGLAIAAGEPDFMQILLGLGFGTLAIVVLFLATWTTNDTNTYVASLSANLFLPDVARWKLAAGMGVLGTIAAVFGIFEHFMSWLIFTGNLFAPLAGVYVYDYISNKKRFTDLENIPAYYWLPLTAWVIGFAVGVATTTESSMGLALFSLTTVPMLDALLAAGAALWALRKVFPIKGA